ncbi:helix-turn-helix domain-containing protein [Chryseobacterium defluvii]|uniref:Uncharacterized protein n=1 Tax=Chryseobacterium defluvii TaxID=160396 RepID=A0A495S951_9FLAO|nr:helix-turn-helix domain-containing protein [Chryseobacterium defluvii]RKS96407.1 hypothetical protein BCF58_2831 [Chryseobacterium defluvii]
MKNNLPDYKSIYSDILSKKSPQKQKECEALLSRESLSALNIIELNTIIFGTPDKQTENFNKMHRSYRKSDILKILDYQKKNNLNNIQLAGHFKLSRNSITKWKKLFQV